MTTDFDAAATATVNQLAVLAQLLRASGEPDVEGCVEPSVLVSLHRTIMDHTDRRALTDLDRRPRRPRPWWGTRPTTRRRDRTHD